MMKINSSNENEMDDLQAGYGHVGRADTLGVCMWRCCMQMDQNKENEVSNNLHPLR